MVAGVVIAGKLKGAFVVSIICPRLSLEVIENPVFIS